MIGKIAGWLGKAFFAVMAFIGVAVVLAAFFIAGAWNSGDEKKKSEPVAAATAETPSAAASCSCETVGAWCDGPRGGRYCLKADGSKKYAPK